MTLESFVIRKQGEGYFECRRDFADIYWTTLQNAMLFKTYDAAKAELETTFEDGVGVYRDGFYQIEKFFEVK